MNLDKLAGIIRSFFHRLLGAGGTEVCEASTTTGKFHTLYVAEKATFTAVVGGGPSSPTWVTEIPAGSTLAAASGKFVTSFTTSSGIVLAYS